jgi:hypothetical protein
VELPPILTYGASWVVITGGTWVLFERAELTMSVHGKQAVSRWLHNVDPEASVATWPTLFGRIFDSVFGERHLSWQCFRRSCVASFLATGLLLIIWATWRPLEWVHLYNNKSFVWIFSLWILGTLLLNMPADYISLLKTRYIIRLMSSATSAAWVIVLLALDILATVAIWTIGSATPVALASLTGSGHPLRTVPGETFIFLRDAVVFSRPLNLPPGFAAGIWLYSAFFTSVWVWLYAASSGALKLGHYLGLGLTSLRFFLDIEDKPIRSLGVVSMGVLTVIYVVLLLAYARA